MSSVEDVQQQSTTSSSITTPPHNTANGNVHGLKGPSPKVPDIHASDAATKKEEESEDDEEAFHDAEDTSADPRIPNSRSVERSDSSDKDAGIANVVAQDPTLPTDPAALQHHHTVQGQEGKHADNVQLPIDTLHAPNGAIPGEVQGADPATETQLPQSPSNKLQDERIFKKSDKQKSGPAVSEWSHQRQITSEESDDEEEEVTWQAMPALGRYDIEDDDGKLIAKGNKEDDYQAYAGLGGAGKGYTRVQLDEDAQSATSLDDDTNYLFKEGSKHTLEEEEARDAMAQLQATKDLLTEGQRIAYVGVTRLSIYNMLKELKAVQTTKSTRKQYAAAVESMDKWGQVMMVRLYAHMDIEAAEQVMIEQLADHGVQPADLVPPLMQNSRIKNPLADSASQVGKASTDAVLIKSSMTTETEELPLQEVKEDEEVPEVQAAEDLPHTEQIDLDLRWTVLCDIFLLLIADSVYDSRSRYLLEQVGAAMDISSTQICRFEKRVIDALEMQEEASKEQWNEEDHIESRRKKGLRRKYMVMGLATVGGGLVIGLSAGLLAPVIGAGLAAGFTTIGVTGTAGFLGGVGGAALITSAATATGGTIAVRASNRRTGHVQTFEYRPLHNNKRLNLIVTVSGWMNGKIDDVRLPYSTVDPIMGDIYSLLWEPEMLTSMGDTISILATEALTQTVQQVLGSTILIGLMASLQLPVVLTKLSYLIDNPWTVSLDRANAAGLILADSLIDRHLGQRPVTLLGFSLGARLIFSCLKELANRRAYGLVQNVYLFGSPIVANKEEYLRVRSIIPGRFVNGYSSSDWVLGYLFRLTSGGIMRVAGLAPVLDVPGLENVDVGHLVNGHMAYRAAMPKIMREVGWEVVSDEFTEIEDPDPEAHAKRQREIIQDIDDSRKKAEEHPLKKRFGIFKRGKTPEKKGWEAYDAEKQGHSRNGSDGDTTASGEPNIFFDIDAIRRELESEMIEVRELDSTLPPMQIRTLDGNDEKRATAMDLPEHDLDPDELAAMKLPPRPSEMEDEDPAPTYSASHRGQSTPIPPDHPPESEDDMDFPMPRELVTTLPPLTLSPSQRPDPFVPIRSSTPNNDSRPPSYVAPPRSSRASPSRHLDTAPTPTTATIPATDLASPVAAMNLEHNAWADDGDTDEFGQSRGDVRMTFE